MKTIIIDDEAKARKTIKEILKYAGTDIEVVAEGESVQTGYKAVLKHQPDLVLLDIKMPDGTGFDLLKKLPDTNFKLIFITAFEQYAIRAFDFSALDYILKPIDPVKLIRYIQKAVQLVENENLSTKLNALFSNLKNIRDKQPQKLILHTEKKIHVVETKNIVYCRADSGYTTFYLIDRKKITISKNLKIFDELLSGSHFFRPHKSYLINLEYIEYYNKQDGGYITMQTEVKIPVSQRKKEQFLAIFENLDKF